MSNPSPLQVRTLPATTPDLRASMALFSRELLASIACGQAGTIRAFHPDKVPTADIALNAAIVVGYQTVNGQQQPVTRTYPLLPGVPILFLGGGGGRLTFPVAAGDTCWVAFLDRDLDVWLQTGAADRPPNTNRLHSMSDAIAIVGLDSFANASRAAISTTDVELYGPDGRGGPRLALGGGKVGISNETGTLVSALNDYFAAMDSLMTTLAAAVISGSAFSPGTIAGINAAKAAADLAKGEVDAILK